MLHPLEALYHVLALTVTVVLEQTVPEVEGAVDTIARLKGLYLLGIITAAPRYEVEHFMAHLGLDNAVFFIFQAAGESEYHKPDPRVFDPLIASLQQYNNIGRSEILYVGDSLSDFYAARDAHLQFTAVLTGATTREQFQAAGVNPEKILDSIIELPERLEL
jgi:phosphoglycolate phosphatase